MKKNNTYKLIYINCLLVLLFPISAFPQQWGIISNTNSVIQLKLDGHYLWAGSGGGVVRWDLRTKTYTKFTSIDGLHSNLVSSVEVDHKGRKWFGGYKSWQGLSCFDGSNWKRYYTNEYLISLNISGIVSYHDTLYISTLDGGICMIDENDNWSKMEQIGNHPTYSSLDELLITKNGDIWYWFYDYSANQGAAVAHFDGSEWTEYIPFDNSTEVKVGYEIFEDYDGKIWLGSIQGAHCFDGQSWTNYKFVQETESLHNFVDAICVEPNGDLWFGTRTGIRRFHEGNWEYYDLRNGQEYGIVRDIVIDSLGNKYFATDMGILTYNGSTWDTLATDDGLVDNYVLDVGFGLDEEVWFCTRGGLSVWDYKNWIRHDLNQLPTDDFTCFGIDNSGLVWIGSADKGVFSFDGSTWKHYELNDDPIYDTVLDIAFDPAGNTWFAIDEGIAMFDGQEITKYPEITNERVFNIGVAPNGNIWACGYDGMIMLDKLSAEPTFFDGSLGAIGTRPHDVAFESDGTVWIGSENGLSKFDGDEWTGYIANDVTIPHVAVDQNDKVWFFYGWQVGWLNDDGEMEFYSTEQGLASTKVANIRIGPDNAKWFPTRFGVSYFRDEPGFVIPKLKISSTMIDFNSVGVSTNKNRSFTISNLGSSNLNIESIVKSSGSADFEIDAPDTFPLIKKYGDWPSRINISFSPSSEGEKMAIVTINSNDPDNPTQTVTLSGVGIQPSTVHSKENILPDSYHLSQNYPNPFNPVTTIIYRIPETAYIRLNIYDLVGRAVAVLVNKQQQAGYYTIRWDGTDDCKNSVASGVYFYKLQTETYQSVRKLLLMR